MGFKCSGCGCCCNRVDIGIEAVKDIPLLKFPYNHTNGRCEMLLEDNSCKVYEDRPLICNVDRMAELLGKDKEEYFILANKACNQMMHEDNIDISFRI